MIQFLYGEQVIRLDDIAADTTVLEWLRLHARQTGTKEGCASGDCGACTVVVANLNTQKNTLEYTPVNSCIAFVGSLHGKQLISVEQLKYEQTLHPVQQAMVDCHGSQCGFCTPGFVMSMFAHFHADEPTRADPHQIDHALAGNLCRCTGYKPIKQAMKKALEFKSDQFDTTKADTIEKLKALQLSDAEHSRYLIPTSLVELFKAKKQNPDAPVVAGATDFALEVTQQLKSFKTLIHLGSIDGLKQIDTTGNVITLGSGVTMQQCLELLSPLVPAIKPMLLRFGSMQVRNQATVGGNIGNASPIGDLPPVLLALDAEVCLQSDGAARWIPLCDFYIDYKKTLLEDSEIISAVRFKQPETTNRFAVYKISKRLDDDISAVCLAISLDIKEDSVAMMRLAFGGMAATPKRALHAEQVAIGKTWNKAAVNDIQLALTQDFTPLSDARASAEYRMSIARNLIERFYLEGTMPTQQTQVVTHVDG